MKITKEQLRQIIKEEVDSVSSTNLSVSTLTDDSVEQIRGKFGRISSRRVPVGNFMLVYNKNGFLETIEDSRRKVWVTFSEDDVIRWYENNGDLHRVDGPAVIYPNGGTEYWTHGEKVKETD